MLEDGKSVEIHGCIVCGKIYRLMVLRSSAGKIMSSTALDPDGRVLSDAERALVACTRHSQDEVERALKKHYPGKTQDEDEENE